MSNIPIPLDNEKWSFLSKTVVRRWGVTLTSVFVALALTEGLWLLVDRPVSAPLFLAAIVLTAWLCGFGYAVVAAILAGMVIDIFFVQPRFEFSGSRDEIVRLIIFVFEGTAIAWLVARLKIAGEEIRLSHQKLQALTDHQQRLREDEQKRIARDVHDELGQALTGLKMHMHVLKGQASTTNGIATGIDQLMLMTDSTISTVRRIASELRPSMLDDLGLVAALEWQTREFERRTSIECLFATDSESIDLGSERNTAMYRIVQEALTNVMRHAEADKVFVDLNVDDHHVNVRVRDNGRGIEKAHIDSVSLGIVGMQERCRMIGGELKIDGSPEKGTVVRLRIPVRA